MPPKSNFEEVNFKLVLGFGKSILEVPDTGTRVLDNTKPFLSSSIVNNTSTF